jgi:pyruvate formate lyase activating enzyme
MKIGGLEKCSLIDYPGKICAIVFTSGCNFRCHYCHNPELVLQTATLMSEDDVFGFLERRKNILDAVTVTGGEPTVHPDLLDFLGRIKELGFLVKLDSNGTSPQVLKEAVAKGLVDYIAMDIKSPLEKYPLTIGREVNIDALKESISFIMESGVDYEFRTTVVKSLLPKEDLYLMGKTIEGARAYYLQKFIPSKTLNDMFMLEMTYSDEEFEEMRDIMLQYVQRCEIR